MKNLLFIILLFVAGNLYASSSAFVASDEPSDIEIEIKEKKMGSTVGSTIKDSRQIVRPTVEALLDCDNGELTFSFNENIGEVVITITNDCGNIVATSICDSNLVSSVTIIVPTTAGSYNIEVVGTQYNGYGEYEL